MKVFLKLMLLVGLLVYLVFAFVRFNRSDGGKECDNLVITIADSDKADFVSKNDILQILNSRNLNPVGKNFKDIQLGSIKKAVDGHQFVLNSVCYATPGGEVVIEVNQKLPVMRVMPDVGEEYYVDAAANSIPHAQYPADVIVVTGDVDYKRDKEALASFCELVGNDVFWSDMIEQINFTRSGCVELTPRLGNHVVELGKPDSLGLKLAHLRLLYEKVLNTVGWNKYSRISLKYNNQAVCTKY